MRDQQHRLPLAWAGVFAAAFAVRAVHVWQMRTTPYFTALMGDSRGYDEWARRIAGGEWLGRDVFYQAPLYPYLLGVVYAIFGRHLLLVRLLQAAIGSASCVLLGMAAARLFSRRAGIVAGLMLAFYAPAVFFDGLLQKSVLDVFFVCLALWIVSTTIAAPMQSDAPARRTRPQPTSSTAWTWLALGLAMGGLALTRENALVLIVVLLAWMVTTPGRFRAAALFAGGLAMVLLPVAARNAYVGGGFYITTSQAGPNFYIGNNPKADGTYQSLRFGRGAPEYERQDATELAEKALGRTLTPGEVSGYWIDKALEFVTSQPGAWLALTARKAALLVNATEMLDTESQEAHTEYSLPLRMLGWFGHFGILVPLAVVGAVATWPMRRRLWVFYALGAGYAASVVAFYVFARYRYPLVPMLVLFAAAGVDAALTAFRRSDASPRDTREHQGGSWWVTASLCAAAAAVICNWPMLSNTEMRAITHTNLAVALQTDGRLQEANREYERAIALQPAYAPAYSNLGTALRAEGRLDDAVAAYERAIALRGEYGEAHYNLANALTDQGKVSQAAEHFRIAMQTMAGSADVHNNLGIALMGEGRAEDAIGEFRAAVAADPQSPKAHRNLADALGSAGHADEAVAEFQTAARLAPNDAAISYDLGSLLLELNRPEEAIRQFQASLAIDPKSPQAHNNLGIALATTGRMDQAIAEFRAALSIDPNFADARRNLQMALTSGSARPGR